MSTLSSLKKPSSDYRDLPLPQLQAILSRFEQRVGDAFGRHTRSKEWVRKAFRRKGAERCPVRMKRISLDAILRYGDELADLYCEFPDDVLCVQAYDSSIGYQSKNREPLNEIEIMIRSAEWADEWGSRWGHAYGGIGATTVANAINDWSELDDYLTHRMPDPHVAGRLDRAKAILAIHGDEKYCIGQIHLALFERLHCLRGMENTFCDLGANEAEVDRLLEVLRDYCIELIREWGQTNISAIFMTDDWGSQTGLMISPAMWRKHFRAHYRSILDEIHRWDKDVIFHSCGNVMGVIPELIDLGVDVLDPVQPTAMNIDEVARRFGGRIAFSGGIDDQRLEEQTPQQVKDEVRHAIDVLARPYGNAHLLAPANVLTPRVPIENIRALLEGCHSQ
jgi:uroporphyrinogen decarboxylase